MSDYRNKRVRANVTLALGYDTREIVEYLQILRERGLRFQIVKIDTGYNEATFEKIEEAILEGKNIFLIAPFFYGNERKRFVSKMHQFCRVNRIRCSFTCMYFDKKWEDCMQIQDERMKQLILDYQDCMELPESYEGWNDIMINHNLQVVRQIVCHYHVIF